MRCIRTQKRYAEKHGALLSKNQQQDESIKLGLWSLQLAH
jgi:hypothetical protein